MTLHDTILVGIDGTAASWRALDWAADEAEHTERRLNVVHVGDVDAAAGAPAVGPALLADAVARLEARHTDIRFVTALLEGNPADVLIHMSRHAGLVVVGRGRHMLPALSVGWVAHRVLAHAHCPTAVVSASTTPTINRVVVGVSDSAGGAAALRFAAAEALRRRAELVAVRTWSAREWRLAAAAAFPVFTEDMWESQERTVLEDCVRPIRNVYPDLSIRTVLSCTPTEIALDRESEGAAMLVLGCRRADDARFPRLGPIASWAAHHFDCPVVIVGNPPIPDNSSAVDEVDLATISG